MENMFEPAGATGILQRLENLQSNAVAQWGKMTVAQMLAHCQVPIECALGDRQQKQSLLGKLFGPIAKKQMLKDTPFKKNLPTDASFVVKDQRTFEKEKQSLKTLIQRLSTANTALIVQRPHPFFGKLTAEELGKLTWKHLNHHLQQFGA